MREGEATELEDLSSPPRARRPPRPSSPPSSPPRPSPQTSPRPSPPPRASPPPRSPTQALATSAATQRAFGASSLLFLLGFALPLGALAWLVCGAGLAASAGLTISYAGTFAPETFTACASLAIIAVGLLYAGIAIARFTRHHQPTLANDSLYLRSPVLTTSVVLLALLGGSVALLGSSTSALADRITTTVVLANVDYLAVLAVLLAAKYLWRWYVELRRWALANDYRAGMWTALLGLAGAGGLALPMAGLHERPIAELEADVDFAAIGRADGFFDLQERVVCVATEEAVESGAAAAQTPQCARLLRGPSGSGGSRAYVGGAPAGASTSDADDAGDAGDAGDGPGAFTACAERLEPELLPLRSKLTTRRVSPDDAYDAVFEALLATCSRVPLPDKLEAYLATTAWNFAATGWKRSRRTERCQEYLEPNATPASCRAARNAYTDQWELSELWTQTMCTLPGDARDIVETRLRDDSSFREIGARFGIGELKAKDTYHNAIRAFRKRLRACVPQ